jgi:uncharacterized coiled-coil protein SlyX
MENKDIKNLKTAIEIQQKTIDDLLHIIKDCQEQIELQKKKLKTYSFTNKIRLN